MKRYLPGFYLLTLSLICQATSAMEKATSIPLPPIYLEKFEYLSSSKRGTLENFYGSIMAVSFFGTDCSWCKKQHNVLKILQDRCSEINTVMMGIGHEKRKLNIDLRRYQNRFPAFLVNNNLTNALESSNVPRLLVFDQQGSAKLNLLGYVPEAELLLILNQQLDFQC